MRNKGIWNEKKDDRDTNKHTHKGGQNIYKSPTCYRNSFKGFLTVDNERK